MLLIIEHRTFFFVVAALILFVQIVNLTLDEENVALRLGREPALKRSLFLDWRFRRAWAMAFVLTAAVSVFSTVGMLDFARQSRDTGELSVDLQMACAAILLLCNVYLARVASVKVHRFNPRE